MDHEQQNPKLVGLKQAKIKFADSYADKIVDAETHKYMLTKFSKLLGINVGVFPSAIPVSLERKHLPFIKENEYLISLKLAGTRYIMWFHKSANTGRSSVFMLDRGLSIFILHPLKFVPENYYLEDCIFDGELVKNRFGKHEFVLLDALRDNQQIVTSYNWTKRNESLQRFHKALNQQPDNGQPFQIQLKNFYPTNYAFLFKLMPTNLPNDGYIFTSVNNGLKAGKDEFLFKWKDLEDITIEFVVKHDRNKYWLAVANKPEPYSIQVIEANNSLLAKLGLLKAEHLIGKILECKRVNGKTWEPLIIRKDKKHANNLQTYSNTLKNFDEAITFDEIEKCLTVPT